MTVSSVHVFDVSEECGLLRTIRLEALKIQQNGCFVVSIIPDRGE